jgi:hypothetical protein
MSCTTSREQFEKDIQMWKQKGLNVTHTFRDGNFPLTSEITSSIEYNLIFNPPRLEGAFATDTGSEWRYKLDFGLLFGQWLIVVVIGSSLIHTLRTKNLALKRTWQQ